jgi:hypothetical protein
MVRLLVMVSDVPLSTMESPANEGSMIIVPLSFTLAMAARRLPAVEALSEVVVTYSVAAAKVSIGVAAIAPVRAQKTNPFLRLFDKKV